jgi:hypothetical protein
LLLFQENEVVLSKEAVEGLQELRVSPARNKIK